VGAYFLLPQPSRPWLKAKITVYGAGQLDARAAA